MCRHRYNKSFIRGTKQEEVCKLGIMLGNISLPEDEEGKCIFHSLNWEWKRQNNFENWLQRLNDNWHFSEKVNLQECHFVGEEQNKQIKYGNLLKNSILDGSVFHDEIRIVDEEIAGSLDFENCTFQKGIFFINCDFNFSVLFSNISTNVKEDKVYDICFENCRFHQFITWKKCKNITTKASFKDCHFNEEVFFYKISLVKESSFEFLDCITTNKMELNEVNLNHWIDFSRSDFKQLAVKNCAFYGEIFFNQISITNNLFFQGSDENRIFHGDTSFDIDFNSFSGEISFENCNLSNILKSHKDILLELEKYTDGKVKIGKGCIKYRTISPNFTFDIKNDHQYFITSLGNVFSTYFSKYNGFNLGVEVRNKTATTITLFYFTDEDIEKSFFTDLLHKTSEQVFLTFQPNQTPDKMNNEQINLSLDFYNAIVKSSNQMKIDNWNLKDTENLMKTLFFSPNINLDTKKIHESIQEIDSSKIILFIQNTITDPKIYSYGKKATIIGKLESDNVHFNQKKTTEE